VCDEGHRLKSAAGNKTIDALEDLGCLRRILLTGTPVQNALDEFYGT
jgi:DNA repair and recombination protein RAD54B